MKWIKDVLLQFCPNAFNSWNCLQMADDKWYLSTALGKWQSHLWTSYTHFNSNYTKKSKIRFIKWTYSKLCSTQTSRHTQHQLQIF